MFDLYNFKVQIGDLFIQVSLKDKTNNNSFSTRATLTIGKDLHTD
jgi:hypothetical protein